MKILFVLEYYYPNVGGIEKLFKNIAEALVQNGDEVLILTNRFDRSLKKNEIIHGVKIKRLGSFNRFFFTLLSLPQILKLGNNYDIIHTTSYNAALPAWIASKLLKKKVIITFHEVWDKLWFTLPFINPFQKIAYYLFEQIILRLKFDKYIAVSNSTQESLISQGIDHKRVLRIYNGIEYPILKNANTHTQENFSFTYLGRLGISKGLELLIPTAKAFILRYPGSTFKMITPDNPKNIYRKIKRLIRKNKLQNDILLLHNLSEKETQKELLSSHCIVITSHSEGFCFVAAEAAALKIPIISSNKKALTEVVSGEYIALGELTKKSLFDALVKAKNSNFEFTPLRKFILKDCTNEYQKLYNELIKN